MLVKAEFDGLLKGVKISRSGPILSHLFFADDSLFFCKADVGHCDLIKNILQAYGLASGQVINFDKSSVYFGKQVSEDNRVQLSGRSKASLFRYIQDRVYQKTNGWKSKLLSPAGRETLIKAVASAVPNYAMTCFKLPKKLYEDLNSIMARFWWV